MKYAIQYTGNGNSHIIMVMGDNGMFSNIALTAGEKDNLAHCKALVKLANEYVEAHDRGDI
jgi:hypothetical protein